MGSEMCIRDSTVSSLDVRSDINPEASQNLRSKSMVENAKASLEKQEEMKKRDKAMPWTLAGGSSCDLFDYTCSAKEKAAKAALAEE